MSTFKKDKGKSKLVSIYKAPNQVAAAMVEGILKARGIKAMVRSLQIPMYNDIAMMAEGAWGEVLVLEEDKDKSSRIIEEYFKKLDKLNKEE